MKFLVRIQMRKIGWKKHPCYHRMMWTLVFPLIRGRDAINPFPSSLPLLPASERDLLVSTAVPWSLGRASLN